MPEAALVFLIFSAAGILSSAPGVTTGDAGELAAATNVLGVAHAPGYPLYALLGRAFGQLMPFGAWTHRMNILSALLGAASLSMITAALKRWGFSRPARLGAVVLLGASPVWRNATSVTEVFALHAFLASLLFWLVSHERHDDGHAAVVGLTFGLALGNHQTMVLLLPFLLLIPGLRARSLALAAVSTLAGFAVYLYLPLRAAASPPLDWGHAVTPGAFLHVLLRRDYGSFALTTDGAAVSGLPGAARELVRGLTFLGAVPAALALSGAALWPKSVRLPRRALLAWVLAAGPLFLLLGRPGFDAQTSGALERFALLPLIGAAALAAGAFAACGSFAPVAAALAAALAFGSPAWNRRAYLAHDYARTLADALPPYAVFVMDGGDDTFYSMAALKWTHGLRPDVELRDRGGVVFPGLYGPDFRRLPREEKEARRRAVEGGLAAGGRLWYSTLNPGVLPGKAAVAAGLLRRPLDEGASFPEADALDAAVAVRLEGGDGGYRDRALAAFIPYSRGVAALARGRVAEAVDWLSVAGERAPDAQWVPSAAGYALALAGYRAMQASDYALGERAYRAWLDLVPGSAEAIVDLGAALQRAGHVKEAEEAYRDGTRRAPGDARPWAALGALAWSRSRWSEAAAAFDEAAARAPDDPAHRGWAAAARRKLSTIQR